MKLRRSPVVPAIVCAWLAWLAWPAPASAANDSGFFRIATGSIGGTYFPIGSLIAGAISNPPGSRACEDGGSCGVPGLIAVALTTQGSVQNVAQIAAGEVESGFVQADIAFWAHFGKGIYAGKGAIGRLRAIANLYPETLHVVVRADSGIESIEQLRRRRVSLGPKASGTVVNARLVLSAYGLSELDVLPLYLRPGRAADLLADRELDALIQVAGHPVAAIADLAERVPIRLLPIDGAAAVALTREHPFFVPSVISDGAYKGVRATSTLSVGAQWLVSADTDAERVYAITKALWHENTRRLLDRGHRKGRLVRIDTALDGIAIPLHEGAVRYYREVNRMP